MARLIEREKEREEGGMKGGRDRETGEERRGGRERKEIIAERAKQKASKCPFNECIMKIQ